MKLIISALLLFAVFYSAFSQTKCPPVDIVFVIDTSGSMNDEGKALCGALNGVVSQLQSKGITLAKKSILGITDTALAGTNCFNGDVNRMFGSKIPGNDPCPFPAAGSESWGPGTAIVAQKFAWTPGALRIVVPISDEGPCQGNLPGGRLGDAKAAGTIANAINIAKANNVIVSPIRGTNDPGFTAAQYADVLKFMTQLASATGGTVTTSAGTKTSTIDMTNNIVRLVQQACITAPTPSRSSDPSKTSAPSQSRAPAASPPASRSSDPSKTSAPSQSRAPAASSQPPSRTSDPSKTSAPSNSRAAQASPPPSGTPSSSPAPPLTCQAPLTGSNLLQNPFFASNGAYKKAYQGKDLALVGDGKGDYDVLNSNQGQTAIPGWTVAAGPILWSSSAFPNAPGTSMTVGMLPGSSIETSFSVPNDGNGYKLSLYVMANPWSPANLRTAAIIQSLRIEVRGATYNRFASPAGFIPVAGNQG